MEAYIVNVGVNKSHEMKYSLKSPIFSDRRFEFIPIPEKTGLSTSITKKYCDLKSFYSKNEDLSAYIPKKCSEKYVHNDPNFEEKLYGDKLTGRGSNLRNIHIGDMILFIASLVQYDKRFDPSKRNFYLIGEIEVEKTWIFPTKLNDEDKSKLKHHAHIIPIIGNNPNQKQSNNEFIAIKGTNKSKRYDLAVPLTKEVCDNFLRDKDNKKFDWCNPNPVIGSYTRTARAFFNPNLNEEKNRWNGFIEYIQNKCE